MPTVRARSAVLAAASVVASLLFAFAARPAAAAVDCLTFTAVAGGRSHSLAVRSDGTVWAWGRNNRGQLGDGTTTHRAVPTQVPGLTGVVAVDAGSEHSLALKSDGTVWGWGENSGYQLGDGTATDRLAPVRVSGLTGVTGIAAGYFHSLALKSDGTVWAWGRNSSGEIGDGTTLGRSTAVQVTALAGVAAIGAGPVHSLAVTSDGKAWAWGWNYAGELGDGTTTDRSTPTAVSGLTNVTAVDGGDHRSVALRSDGTAWVWGYAYNRTPAQQSGATGLISVAVGGGQMLGRRPDGTVLSWGYATSGELGRGDLGYVGTAAAIPDLSGATAVAAGYSHTLVLRTGGALSGFGSNVYGQLGDGSSGSRATPLDAYGVTGASAVRAGVGHGLALLSDGTVRSWGDNGYGALGDGTNDDRAVAAAVPGLSGVTAIAAGFRHSVALKSDGTVWTWGWNHDGQLGLGAGAANPVYTPTQVPGLTGVTAVAAGEGHSVALKSDGTVWAWGDNSTGQLGDGTTTSRSTPGQVPGLTGVEAIASGGDHVLARRTGGTLWVWGSNYYGQLGDGTNAQRATPQQVAGLPTVTGLAASPYHSVVLASTGAVYAWGRNDNGQLGDGSTTARWSPTPVTGATSVARVAAGDQHTLAVKTDGTLLAWGTNAWGELGDGTVTTRTAPVAALATGVAEAAGGGSFSLARTTDGRVVGWGAVGDGTLADGSNGRRLAVGDAGCRLSMPVQLGPAAGAAPLPGTVTFAVRAVDADAQNYHVVIRLKNSETGTLQEFLTATVASGGYAVTSPSVAAGVYTWSAYAVDATGTTSPVSGSRTLTVNTAPGVPALVTPAAGATIGSTGPQPLTARATDPDGNLVRLYFRVRDTGGTVVRSPSSALVGSGADATVTLSPALPPGSYTWTAYARDQRNVTGAETAPRTFVVGTAPTAPALVAPAAGGVLPASGAQVFTIRTTDPDGSAYTGTVSVRHATTGDLVTTFGTASAASGATSSGSPAAPVPTGSYTWTATATDATGDTSPVSSYGTFSVDSRPNAPELLAPTAGAALVPGGATTFRVRATDPDGHGYTATITVRDADGTVVRTATTPRAASGAEAAVTLASPLPSGSYTWTAVATDDTGATGNAATASPFRVSFPPNVQILEPADGIRRAPNTTLYATVWASDADGDGYTAAVTVRTESGTLVQSATTPRAESNTTAAVQIAPLPTGRYVVSVVATDDVGAAGPVVQRAFQVGAAPPAPALLAPADGTVLRAGTAQRFSLRVTDPDGEDYTGWVRVRDAATGGLVRLLPTQRTASGAIAVADASPPLPAGTYRWSAYAVDAAGATGPASAERALTVTLASDECTSGPVYDGFVGSAYARVRVQPVDPYTTWICWRADDGRFVQQGGKFVVSSATLSNPPVVDEAAGSCASAGDAVPTPHPIQRGQIGDETDPLAFFAYEVDAAANTGGAMVCLRFRTSTQTFPVRVSVPVPDVGVPVVSLIPDSTGAYQPARPANPGSASGTCQNPATGRAVEHVNARTALGGVWLAHWQETGSRVHLCVRAAGGLVAGGRLTIDAGTSAIAPVVDPSPDPELCEQVVAEQDGLATFSVRRSAAVNPATVCVTTAAGTVAVTAGATGTLVPPAVTWTQDTA